MKKQSKSPGRRLTEALTKEQLEKLIDIVGSKTLLDKIKKGGGNGDGDMADTVKKVLASKTTPGKKNDNSKVHVASDRKFVEEWNDLWGQWDDIVAEVGDEDGKYTVQEHHWESPYFDGSALASDLEKVAVEMTKKIDRVFELVDEEELFTDAIEEIDQAIRSYPDWMGAGCDDGCTLEYQTSQCVLKWLRLSSRHDTKPGAAFLEKIESIDSGNELVALDRNAIIDFIAGLPERICREIYGELSKGRFSDEQQKVYSPWNALMLDFKRRYDKDEYLAQCGRDLEQDWHLGRPLIEKALAGKNLQEAEQWLIKTFSSYIHGRGGKKWFPESSLLEMEDGHWREQSEKAEASKLLLKWSEVSTQLGNNERAVAARFQAAAVRNPDALERIVEEFKVLRNKNETASLDLLFRQWQDETAQTSYRQYRDPRRSGDTWVHWMIDAQTEGKTGIARFRKKLDEWLNVLTEDGGKFKSQLAMFTCLTVDLAENIHRNRFAGLFTTALKDFRQKTELDKFRSSIVRGLCQAGTINMILEIWRKRFVQIIPDPSSSGSDYLQPVTWVKVLRDLNPDAYAKLIKQWTKIHHLRRNLWKAMSGAKLPVE